MSDVYSDMLMILTSPLNLPYIIFAFMVEMCNTYSDPEITPAKKWPNEASFQSKSSLKMSNEWLNKQTKNENRATSVQGM